jgi:hypothetical protein
VVLMIARVRIAPVEKWKDRHPNLIGELTPGMEVSIYTDGMWIDSDGGEQFKSWRVPPEEADRLRKIIGGYGDSICEHLLEMD